MADADDLRVPFSLRAISGLIAVSVTRNTDPGAIGYFLLFDAPSRDSKDDMTWEAHSFPCVSPDAVLTRHVQAIAGFSWGFTINQQDITFALPAALGPEAWNSHLDLLRTDYPVWIFDSGYLPA